VERLSEHERRIGPKEALRETVLSARTNGNQPKKPFKGKCFHYGKRGYRKLEYRARNSPSIGPLATPNRGRGLSPGPIVDANTTIEASWIALTGADYRGTKLL